jgi:hypothetical protein
MDLVHISGDNEPNFLGRWRIQVGVKLDEPRMTAASRRRWTSTQRLYIVAFYC